MGEKYASYLKTAHWEKKRKERLKRDSYACMACGEASKPLHVHHRTYSRIGRELPHDLRTLCGHCHENIHYLVKSWAKSKKDTLRILTNRFINSMRGNILAGNRYFKIHTFKFETPAYCWREKPKKAKKKEFLKPLLPSTFNPVENRGMLQA